MVRESRGEWAARASRVAGVVNPSNDQDDRICAAAQLVRHVLAHAALRSRSRLSALTLRGRRPRNQCRSDGRLDEVYLAHRVH
jgi:hypothetical protein